MKLNSKKIQLAGFVAILCLAHMMRIPIQGDYFVDLGLTGIISITAWGTLRLNLLSLCIFHVIYYLFNLSVKNTQILSCTPVDLDLQLVSFASQAIILFLIYRIPAFNFFSTRWLRVYLLIPLVIVYFVYLQNPKNILNLVMLLLMIIITILMIIRIKSAGNVFWIIFFAWLTSLLFSTLLLYAIKPLMFYDPDPGLFLQNLLVFRLPVDLIQLLIGLQIVTLFSAEKKQL